MQPVLGSDFNTKEAKQNMAVQIDCMKLTAAQPRTRKLLGGSHKDPNSNGCKMQGLLGSQSPSSLHTASGGDGEVRIGFCVLPRALGKQ